MARSRVRPTSTRSMPMVRSSSATPGNPTRERVCATDRINDDVFVISYLAVSGYTLTVALNFRDHRMVGYASNEEAWYRQQGTFELASDES